MTTIEEVKALVEDYKSFVALLDKYKLEKRFKDIQAARVKLNAIMAKAGWDVKL